MNTLYEKLAAERDKLTPYTPERDIENIIFVQLLSIAFTNTYPADELPHFFLLRNVMLDAEQLKKLLSRIGLSAYVELKSSNYSQGNIYSVTLEK